MSKRRKVCKHKFVVEAENKSGVYILDFGNCVKVGRAKDISRRVLAYSDPHCRPVKAFKYYYRDKPEVLESLILNAFWTTENDGEWLFNTSLNAICNFVDKGELRLSGIDDSLLFV